jgi:hypothetical protein
MPITSKAQQRLMYAAASGKAKDGPSKKVAKEFIEATPKQAYAEMPEKAKGKKKVVLKRKGGY